MLFDFINYKTNNHEKYHVKTAFTTWVIPDDDVIRRSSGRTQSENK
jgi:hypothetical protein